MTMAMAKVLQVVVLATVIAATVSAQDSTAAASERKVTGGVFSPAQATRGEGTYRTVCEACHAKSEYTGDKFKTSWVSKTVFDLFDQLRTTMPDDNPGSLERQEYIDVVAYIFSLNAFPSGASDLPTDDDGLKKIRIDDPPPPPGMPQALVSGRGARMARPHPRVAFRK